MANFKRNTAKDGRVLYVEWVEVDSQATKRYDIFDEQSRPLYKWADAKKLAEFIGAVELGDSEYLDGLKQENGEWVVLNRCKQGDRRPFEESLKKMYDAVAGSRKSSYDKLN